MQPFCLLGASGFTGALIAGELAARGDRFVACGRDVTRVQAAVAPFGDAVAGVRRVDVGEPPTLRAALEGAGVAISTIGPYSLLGRGVVDAAIAHRVDLVDVSGEQEHLRWVHEERDLDAQRAGVRLVPGAGFTGAMGDLLAGVAASAAGPDPEVHVAYMTAGAGRRGWSNGTRATIASQVGRAGYGYIDGALETEPLGEGRRLAWFPRPVGPMHAAAVPGVEAVTVPRHVPEATTVRTYLAMSTWKAEAFQAIGNLSRWDPVRRRLVGWLEREAPDPTESQRFRTRWACVAEARGALGIARAWAYGRDPYGTAASLAAWFATTLAAGGGAGPGVLPAAAVIDPTETLDVLSARTGLRWSVTRPNT